MMSGHTMHVLALVVFMKLWQIESRDFNYDFKHSLRKLLIRQVSCFKFIIVS